MSEPSATSPRSPAIGWLFVAAVAGHALPLWLVDRVLTMDGPSHVYNGWLLSRLFTGRYPWLERVFAVRWEPVPNWTAEALLGMATVVFSPALAERLVLTLYLALFGWSLWVLAGAVDERRSWAAFLALPWIYNWAVDAGFYSYCFGIAGFALSLGLGLRMLRDGGRAWVVHLALLATYFSHLVPHLAALGALALASLFIRGRAGSFVLRVLAPQAILPLWFLWRQRTHGSGGPAFEWRRLEGVLRFDWLLPWNQSAEAVAAAAMVCFWCALGATLFAALRRRAAATAVANPAALALVAAAALFALILVVAPETALGGGVIALRLLLPILLCLLPAVDPPGGRWLRRCAVGLGLSLSLTGAVAMVDILRERERDAASAIAAGRSIPRRATFISVVTWPATSPRATRVFQHIDGYVAAERALVDLSNYEGDVDLFPIRFRDGLTRPPLYPLTADPASIDLTPFEPHIDAVMVHGPVPRGTPLNRSLRTGYRRAVKRGPHTLWLAKRLTPAEPPSAQRR